MIDYKDARVSADWIRSFARHFHHHYFKGSASSIELADFEQEMWGVWCNCVRLYDADKGASFRTYLETAMRNHASRLATAARRRTRLWVDAPVRNDGEGNRVDVIDLLVNTGPSGEEALAGHDFARYVRERMDPRLARIAEMIADPPEELQAEVEALAAKAAYGASRGVASRQGQALTLGMMCDLFGLGRSFRYNSLADLRKIVEEHDSF